MGHDVVEDAVQITRFPASQLAGRIRHGNLSAREVIEAHMRRIDEVNHHLNGVRTFERALAEAGRRRRHPDPRGDPLALHGVPVTIKEQYLVAGTPTTLGLPGRALHHAEADGPLVGRLRKAGAIVLGKANVSQLLTLTGFSSPPILRWLGGWACGVSVSSW